MTRNRPVAFSLPPQRALASLILVSNLNRGSRNAAFPINTEDPDEARTYSWSTTFCGPEPSALALVLSLAAGCKSQPAARTDQQLTTDIQAKINGESALTGQNIQVSVVNGVAT